MKMKAIGKRALAGLLSILLVVGCCVTVGLPKRTVRAATTYTSGDFKYQVLEDGTAEIIDYTGSVAELEIPEELDGHKVTSIGDRAFIYCHSLASVTIGNSVTRIGISAFFLVIA